MKRSLIAIILFSLISCQKEIDLLHRNDEQKLVLWCYLHPDSVVTAYVSKTSPPLSTKEDRTASGVLVVLYENNLPVDTLQNDSLKIYKSRKNFKPSVGNIYAMKASKSGFPTLETFPDTMPPKPVLLKYIAEDSILRINRFQNLARLRLYTDKPKYFESYGLSQGKYQNINYLGVYGDDVFDWFDYTDRCEKHFGVPWHGFVRNTCVNNDVKGFYEFTKLNYTSPQQLKGKKMSLSFGAITNHCADLILKIQPLGSTTFSDGTELFWTPVYVPETVKNGYGFLVCYNTLDFDIHF